jgi:hypothetical protein
MVNEQDIAARLLSLLESSATGQGLLHSVLAGPFTAAERTDTVGVADGEMNSWVSGSSIWQQQFSAKLGAWKKHELT